MNFCDLIYVIIDRSHFLTGISKIRTDFELTCNRELRMHRYFKF